MSHEHLDIAASAAALIAIAKVLDELTPEDRVTVVAAAFALVGDSDVSSCLIEQQEQRRQRGYTALITTYDASEAR